MSTPEHQPSEREQEVLERVRNNPELMRAMQEAEASILRGEPGIPGKQVQEEARARRAQRTPA